VVTDGVAAAMALAVEAMVLARDVAGRVVATVAGQCDAREGERTYGRD
jgi:hypothetical protein